MKVQVFSGPYLCPECGQEYQLYREPEDQLFCEHCGFPLVEASKEEPQSSEFKSSGK